MIKRNIYVEFFKKYQNKFSDYFKEKENVGFDFQFPSAYNHIYNELLRISLYALTYELNEFRLNNKLVGDTSAERFEYFEKIASSDDFFVYFSKKYPVLIELMDKKITNIISFFDEILNNFINDHLEIEKLLKVKIKKITDVVLGQGDTHNNGKTVAILYFSDINKKIIYKPHSLDTDKVLSDLLNVTNQFTSLKLEHLQYISFGNHGWQEFKEFHESNEKEDIKNLYTRLGYYLGLFYVMNTSDMHYENLIINDDSPFFIDTETLMVPSRFENKNYDNTLYFNNFEDSIMLSALLPFKTKRSFMDMDLSGIFGEKIVSKKFKTMNVVDYGLDTMHIEKKLLNVVDNKQNKNKRINIFEYRDDLLNGFSEIINIIINNKNEFYNFFEQQIPSTLKIRQILRPTMIYAKFLEAALNPAYLVDFTSRDSLYKILLKGNDGSTRVYNEIECLKIGDVPYYMSAYDNCNLYDGEGNIVDTDFFVTSPKDCILSKIKYLTKENLDYQEELIKLSYTSKLEPLFSNNMLDIVRKEKDYSNKKIILDIITKINRKKFYNQPFKSYDYAMIHLVPSEAYIGGLNISLYEGIGILLTMLYESKLSNKDTKDLESMISILDFSYKLDMKSLGCSVFDGKGSLVYLFYNTYKLLGKAEYYDKYRKVLNDLLDDAENTNQIDFMYGLSGIITLLYNINNDDNCINLDGVIERFGKIIITNLEKEDFSIIGFAHGLSGLSYALLLCYQVTKNEYFYNYSIKLINKENSVMKNEYINVGWCRGYSGILLARSLIKDLIKNSEKDILNLNELTNQFIEKFFDVKSYCLCHGLFGNIMIAFELIKNKILSEEEENILEKYIDKSYQYIDDIGKIPLGLTNNYEIDGLMLGTSGIAYSLMYIENYNVPFIFNLQIYKER